MSKKSADRAAQRAARTAALLAEQKRAERRRQVAIGAAVVAVVVLILGIAFWVQSSRDTTGDTPATVPTGATDEYGVVVGEESAPTTLTIYEDLQCPVCATLEDATADQVAAAVDAGEVRVDYRMVSFLDDASTNDYSSRALNALLVVLDTAGVEAFRDYHDLLFANQTAEGGPGHDDDQLIEYAVEAGADESEIRDQIEDRVYEQWIENATDQMSQNGVSGTPTVEVDGERVEGSVQDSIDAVLAAVSG